jgi:hypothetical protein
MATVAGIKIKIKKPRKDPAFHDEKHIGSEPVWDHDRALELSPEVFDNHLRKSFRYYNYFYNQKDLKKLVVEWLQKHGKLTKKQLAIYIQSAPDQTPMTLCSLVKAMSKGMPMKDRHKEYILGKVMGIVEAAQDAPAPKVKMKKGQEVYVPTIQDRLAEKTAEVIGEIEGEVDNVFTKKPTTMKVYDYLTAKGVAQSQIGKIRAVFMRQIVELTEAVKGDEPQLKEAYSHLKKADYKRIGDWYVKLLADLDAYQAAKKATKKAKAPRAVSKDKLVSKVKYMKESKELKLVSVNPVDIIGATAVWVYHAKYRKLGKYVVDAHTGTLSVKGTSILGYDPGKSTAKTLRKPAEQLAEFMKCGKVQLRTFLTNIKAVETKLNGRLNAEILILKVE